MAAKVRPALVVNAGYGEADRALLTMVPHTTALRGSQYEIVVNATFLKPGAFLVQGVTSVPRPFALHRLGFFGSRRLIKSPTGYYAGSVISASRID